MRIFIDGDGCPVVTLAVHLARKYHLECFIICDTSHQIDVKGAQTITVSKGADSVDYYLVNLLQKGDVVITQDYGLASMCLAKEAAVLNQNGLVFTAENIDGLLFSRYAAQKVREAGGRLKGPAKRKKEQDQAFVKALEKQITSAPN